MLTSNFPGHYYSQYTVYCMYFVCSEEYTIVAEGFAIKEANAAQRVRRYDKIYFRLDERQQLSAQ